MSRRLSRKDEIMETVTMVLFIVLLALLWVLW